MFLSYGHYKSTLMKNLSCGVLPSRQRLLFELYPRALPPVTQSSALQAPECMRDTSDVTTIRIGYDASYSALLPGGQYHE